VLVTALLLLAACSSGSSTVKTAPTATTTVPVASGPRVGHVFVINLENKNYATTWGKNSVAKYLNGTLVPMGQLLTQYYGTSHASLGNYITQISGRPSNAATNGDCITFTEYRNGEGCVYRRR
jgi:phosphatidylinositol-3-phosphatase